MNMRTVSAWAGRMMMVPAMVASLALCGCESEDTDSDITATRFFVDRELKNYSSTDEFTWDTTLTEAVVTVRIDDFHEGDTTLRVYDGRGELIFTRALNTGSSAYFTGDDLFFQQRTDAGQAGQWRVVVGYSDFTGEISITME